MTANSSSQRAPTKRSVAPDAPSAAGVTILIPAYNEEQGIGGVLERLATLDIGRPLELLIVNDGSTDGTERALADAQRTMPTLRVINRPKNQGYGASLKLGFSQARHDVVVITDADGTYPEDRIADLVDLIDDGAEMVVGERTGEDVLEIRCEARCTGATGVEMEAMCGASVAALTVYDMTKAVSKGIRIERVELLEKDGGKSGAWRAAP